ncbi:copper chaperone PCu(A)C [Ferrimonas lipolytica]|uniref:Copper chaperone PCu(A)C n=1 Tax=Ferrimonas lipolytica TaxID=2724191 RepID=A0A6H1UG27_9GAMM|nr:copper chaperone PCu(A)C [Ferrimonas lipolytica]QIZ77778.1 copper chaperone PCu(A)C [Ferrimonas lipolytica]
MIKRLFEFSALSAMLIANAWAGAITVSAPTVRAMPASVPNTAGYVQLTATEQDDALLSARCEGITVTELHTLLMEDGMMKMRPVDAILLPHNQLIELEQGGYHLMMMGLQRPLTIDDTVSCQLSFKLAPPQMVDFTVRRMGKPAEHHHHHH